MYLHDNMLQESRVLLNGWTCWWVGSETLHDFASRVMHAHTIILLLIVGNCMWWGLIIYCTICTQYIHVYSTYACWATSLWVSHMIHCIDLSAFTGVFVSCLPVSALSAGMLCRNAYWFCLQAIIALWAALPFICMWFWSGQGLHCSRLKGHCCVYLALKSTHTCTTLANNSACTVVTL